MGADLIGFFAKGPKRLPTQGIPAAIAEAERRLEWLQQARQVIGSGDDAALVTLLPNCPWVDSDQAHHKPENIDLEALGCEIQHLIDAVGDIAQLTGEKAVNEFTESWPPQFRDTAHIVDPDCPDKLIVFAGERTWGDTPDGAGFKLLSRASVLGIAPILGVWMEAAFISLRILLTRKDKP